MEATISPKPWSSWINAGPVRCEINLCLLCAQYTMQNRVHAPGEQLCKDIMFYLSSEMHILPLNGKSFISNGWIGQYLQMNSTWLNFEFGKKKKSYPKIQSALGRFLSDCELMYLHPVLSVSCETNTSWSNNIRLWNLKREYSDLVSLYSYLFKGGFLFINMLFRDKNTLLKACVFFVLFLQWSTLPLPLPQATQESLRSLWERGRGLKRAWPIQQPLREGKMSQTSMACSTACLLQDSLCNTNMICGSSLSGPLRSRGRALPILLVLAALPTAVLGSSRMVPRCPVVPSSWLFFPGISPLLLLPLASSSSPQTLWPSPLWLSLQLFLLLLSLPSLLQR